MNEFQYDRLLSDLVLVYRPTTPRQAHDVYHKIKDNPNYGGSDKALCFAFEASRLSNKLLKYDSESIYLEWVADYDEQPLGLFDMAVEHKLDMAFLLLVIRAGRELYEENIMRVVNEEGDCG